MFFGENQHRAGEQQYKHNIHLYNQTCKEKHRSYAHFGISQSNNDPHTQFSFYETPPSRKSPDERLVTMVSSNIIQTNQLEPYTNRFRIDVLNVVFLLGPSFVAFLYKR